MTKVRSRRYFGGVSATRMYGGRENHESMGLHFDASDPKSLEALVKLQVSVSRAIEARLRGESVDLTGFGINKSKRKRPYMTVSSSKGKKIKSS